MGVHGTCGPNNPWHQQQTMSSWIRNSCRPPHATPCGSGGWNKKCKYKMQHNCNIKGFPTRSPLGHWGMHHSCIQDADWRLSASRLNFNYSKLHTDKRRRSLFPSLLLVGSSPFKQPGVGKQQLPEVQFKQKKLFNNLQSDRTSAKVKLHCRFFSKFL